MYSYGEVFIANATPEYQWWRNASVPEAPVDYSITVESLQPHKATSSDRAYWVLLSLLPFVLTWVITNFIALQTRNADPNTQRKPELMPYWFPWVGHTLEFYFSKINFAAKIRTMGKNNQPVRLRFFNYQVNVVSGFEHVSAVWKSRVLDTKPVAMLSLTTFFQSPSSAYNLWANDDSGGNSRPHPKSNIPHVDRIYYHTHKTSHAFMTGATLKGFALRFQELYQRGLGLSKIEGDWKVMPDLYSFVQTTLSTAAVEAMCGPSLLALNPNFIEDFWTFDGALPKFFGGLPRITAPAAYSARTRCLESIKKWHSYAQANFEESSVDSDGHDPYWGTTFMRARQKIWGGMKDMTADGCASEDLGILWGENSNSIPGAFWCLAHVVRDAELLRRVRVECKKCITATPSGPKFDADRLCRNPLLQSIWSEAMRMYVALFVIRGSDHDAFQLDKQHVIGKGQLIAVDSYTAHHDESVWNQGTSADPHPVSEFWADRFLIYPNDPLSGPVKAGVTYNRPTVTTEVGPQYSTAGLTGAWIPFGGGRHSCPGMQFAKQEMILCMSMMVTLFDIELDPETKLTPDMDYFGMGALPFKGAAPFRIRRRPDSDDE